MPRKRNRDSSFSEASLNEQLQQHVLDRACKELLPHLALMQILPQLDHRMDRVAEYMSLAPATVSFRINRLQEDLQEPVIERTRTDQRRLTDLGRRYVMLADEVLPSLQRFLDEQCAKQASHVVKIGTIHSAWNTYSEKLKHHCKGIEFVVDTPGRPEAVKEGVIERSIDIGILSYDVVVRPPIYRHLWKQEEMVLAAGKTWAHKSHAGRVTRERIAESTVLLFRPGRRIEEVVRAYLLHTLRCPLNRLRHVGGEIETVITSVENGEGVSILPLPTIADNPKINYYSLPVPMAPRPISVIWHRDSFKNSDVRTALSFFGVERGTGRRVRIKPVAGRSAVDAHGNR